LVQQLDKLDMQLLALVQQNNLLTADQLAERIGLSPSAIARRLRRLRASGAIIADVRWFRSKRPSDRSPPSSHHQHDRQHADEDDRLRRGWWPVQTSSSASTSRQPSTPAALDARNMREYNASPTRRWMDNPPSPLRDTSSSAASRPS
jgi:biotin operon repressor